MDRLKVTEAIDSLFDYKTPLSNFIHEQPAPEILRLAIELLRYAGVEDEIPDILKLLEERRGLPVQVCPRCEGTGVISGKTARSKDHCRRCKGLGYLLQQEEIVEEEDDDAPLSRVGRLARNRGEPWTAEQEAHEQGHESLKDYLDDSHTIEDLPPFLREEAACKANETEVARAGHDCLGPLHEGDLHPPQ